MIMKKINLIQRLKKWFFNDILNPYLIEFHPNFLLIVNNVTLTTKFSDEKSQKEYKRIMKILNSQKYKKMFYNIVEYKIGETPIPKHENNFFGKIKRFFAKQYLRFFNKELYNNLLRFKKISERFNELNVNIDNYLKNTTLDERAERAKTLGVSSDKNTEAHIRMRNINNMRIAAIHERNSI